MDLVIDRLAAAYEEAGLPPILRSDDVEALLAEIRTAIAPLRLPAEVEQFWRRVDPSAITLAPYPHPTGIDFALHAWRSHAAEPGMVPRLLFPIAYESHGFLFVELEDGHGSGGTVLSWGYTDDRFVVQFPTLSAYLDLLATMIELGEFTRHPGARGYIAFDPEGRWEDAVSVRLAAAQPVRGFPHVRHVSAQPVTAWPEHWLVADGLTPQTRTAHGATTTIAELLRRAAAGDVARGTIRAHVTRLAGSHAGRRVNVEDSTGALDIWCPAELCAYGPVMGKDFEFDVVVRPVHGPTPDWDPLRRDIAAHANALDIEGAQAAARDLYSQAFESTAAAEATAIRPVD